jgi:oxalate decarboxylase/phosphoglucose isomerase-like protein (cupin superfamily)
MERLHSGLVKGVSSPDIPQYVFERLKQTSPLLHDVQVPDVLDPDVTMIIPQSFQFYLGPAESGSPMHIHQAAWNAQLFGRKRWFLMPPSAAYYTTIPAREWLVDFYPRDSVDYGMLECTQESGDVVFVPPMWGHATLNLAESIGIASEFTSGSDEFSI